MQTKDMLIIGLMLSWACTQSSERNSSSMRPPPAGNPDASLSGATDAGSDDRDGDGLTNEQEAMLNTNPDKAVWDLARNAVARFKPSNLGISSESTTDDESVEFTKTELDETVFMGTWDDPVYIRVSGYRNASAPYTLTIEAL